MLSIIVRSTGQRLDVYPNETIELNMGGISLLNLADRTVSYTNSFKSPKTPNNEAIYEFASQPTRTNRPVIDVVISKGLFQKNAALKVKEFDKDYKCELRYAVQDTIDKLNLPICELFDSLYTITNPNENELYKKTLYPAFTPITYRHKVNQNNAAVLLDTLFSELLTRHGIEVDLTTVPEIDTWNLCLFTPFISFEYVDGSPSYIYITTDYNANRGITTRKVLKTLAQMFMCDVLIEENKVTFKKSYTTATPISIETLTKTNKTFYSGLGSTNVISYKLNDKGINQYFGADRFNGDGDVEKKILEIENTIPTYGIQTISGFNLDGYDLSSINANNEICLMYTTIGTYAAEISGSYTNLTEVFKAEPLTMSGYYSTILNPIFANPVILNADGYIDPLTADTIMRDRVIVSVKLGGRYWVDEMKYNLTTGKSVLKLIKL